MSEHKKPLVPLDDPELKGIRRVFNSTTIRGRANVTKATLVGLLAAIIYYRYLRDVHITIKPTRD